MRSELHLIDVDLAAGALDGDIWGWWHGGFAEFLVWCGCW